MVVTTVICGESLTNCSLLLGFQVPFEMLVRRQIARLLEPSLQCARFVYEELVKVNPLPLLVYCEESRTRASQGHHRGPGGARGAKGTCEVPCTQQNPTGKSMATLGNSKQTAVAFASQQSRRLC